MYLCYNIISYNNLTEVLALAAQILLFSELPLTEVQKLYNNVVFVTYLTVEPQTDNLPEYINNLSKLLEQGYKLNEKTGF